MFTQLNDNSSCCMQTISVSVSDLFTSQLLLALTVESENSPNLKLIKSKLELNKMKMDWSEKGEKNYRKPHVKRICKCRKCFSCPYLNLQCKQTFRRLRFSIESKIQRWKSYAVHTQQVPKTPCTLCTYANICTLHNAHTRTHIFIVEHFAQDIVCMVHYNFMVNWFYFSLFSLALYGWTSLVIVLLWSTARR